MGDRPSFAELKISLDEQHAILRGEKPRLTRQPSKRASRGWRDEFEKEQLDHVHATKQQVTEAFELTKKVFAGAQALYRYATDETVAEMVEELMPTANELLAACKPIPDVDKTAYKNLAAGVTGLVKAKNKLPKIHPAADLLRNGARELNKSLRNIIAPPV